MSEFIPLSQPMTRSGSRDRLIHNASTTDKTRQEVHSVDGNTWNTAGTRKCNGFVSGKKNFNFWYTLPSSRSGRNVATRVIGGPLIIIFEVETCRGYGSSQAVALYPR